VSFKLVYVSGDGVSNWLNKKGYWGGTAYSDTDIQMHITNTKNERISPPPDFPPSDSNSSHNDLAYKLPGTTSMDPELKFPNLSPPLAVTAGQQFRIWFGQDLLNMYEADNEGQTCANVWIRKI
jgi:hypothetical protein